MNLKEHYKRRLQEDLQTPGRAKEIKAMKSELARQAKRARALGNPAAAEVYRDALRGATSIDTAEKYDERNVFGIGGQVVGRIVPTTGSAGARKPTR